MKHERSFMVFYRSQDELRLRFFDSLFDNARDLERWLNTPVEKGGALGLQDVMSGNGMRDVEQGDVASMIAGRRPSFPVDSFLVIEGAPLSMIANKQVISYSVPS